MATDYVVRLTGLDNLSKTINNVKRELQETGLATTLLDSINNRFNRIQQSAAPLKKKLKDLKALMAQMNLDGLSNTDVFSKMAQEAGRYSDALKDAGTATAAFANDNFKLEAMAQGLQGIAGAASVATGIMGILGSKNQDLAKAILKVQSVLAVLNGVQAVANILNKDSALMLRIKQIREMASAAATTKNTVATTANTVATTANTASTVANTVAQNAWNVAKAVAKALLGDWTGLVLVGAVALSTYAIATDDSTDSLEKQASATDKAKEAQKKYNDSVASTAGQLVSKYKLLQNAWKNLKTISEKNQWIKDNASEFRNLGLKINDVKSAETTFVNNTPKVVAALKARAQAMAALEMLQNAYEDYFKTVFDADNSVKGGGYYNPYKGNGGGWSTGKPNITDEMKSAGVTPADYNQRTTTKRTGGMIYDTTEYQESKTVIDKVNKYRQQQQRKVNQNIKSEAENNLNKTVDFATDLINKALNIIDNAGLDYNQNSNNSSSVSNHTTNTNTNTNSGPTYEAGSLADLETQYNKLQDELKNTNVSDERLKQIQTETAALETQISALKVRNGFEKAKTEDSPELKIRNAYKNAKDNIAQIEDDFEIGLIVNVSEAEAKIAEVNQKLKNLGLKPIEVKLTPTTIELKRAVYSAATEKVSQIKEDYRLNIINKEDAKKQLTEINKQLTDLGIKPIELYIDTDSIKDGAEALDEYKEKQDTIANAVGSFGLAFSSLGGAIDGTSGAILDLAGQTIQAVALIIPQIVALIGAKEGEALAAGTASGAALPFPANIAAIASIVATITALFASFAGKFAEGGIIGGSSLHGDNLLARVNSGEMILNGKQQANLFNMLNGNSNGSGNNTGYSVRIKGSDLYLALNNYNSKINKIK